MIQELLGGASSSFIEGERKISINEGILSTPSPTSLLSSPSPASFTPSVTTTSITTAAAAAATTSKNQNLRCPRCDSSNTKFCYYNNYNLTQPRHFCKTCRRYWTKGGALRNVPIGGGCRKNRSTGMSNTVARASVTKMKAATSELGRVFDHDLPQSPILWGSPQNTHLLAFLRARQSQNQNRNPNPNPIVSGVTVKEERNLRSQPHMGTEPLFANGALNPRIYDATVGQVPSHSLGMCSSFWRNNEDQIQQANNGFVLGEHQSSGIQELHHKLRSSSSVSYCIDNSPIILGNTASTSSLSNILEPSSVSGTEFGCWNPTLSWSDIPTTNGPYP